MGITFEAHFHLTITARTHARTKRNDFPVGPLRYSSQPAIPLSLESCVGVIELYKGQFARNPRRPVQLTAVSGAEIPVAPMNEM